MMPFCWSAAKVGLTAGTGQDRKRGVIVTTTEAPLEEAQRNRVMVVGGVLVGVGGLLGAAGALLVSSAFISATRRWMRQLDPPPSTIAKVKWQQARAATTAGARAWRNGPST
jgi:hypothetical protein